MGGSRWSDDFYRDREDTRARTATPAFKYDHDIRSGAVAAKVHETLDPKHIVIRESRDSDAHPESNSIMVFFDVTASMGGVPRVLQKKLPGLMSLLLAKGYIAHPQVCFGAVGDAISDSGSLQVGQFESGIEMDNDLTNIWCEGGGGGSNQESYQNAIHFAATQTSMDCFEKRGKKGYLFLIGDEAPYPSMTAREYEKVFGKKLQGTAIRTEDIIAAARDKFHVFFIIPKGTSNAGQAWLKETWDRYLGPENVILLDNAESVCESIGLAVGLVEGTVNVDTVEEDLKSVGVTTKVVKDVVAALDPLAKKTALARTGTGGSLPEKGKSAAVERL